MAQTDDLWLRDPKIQNRASIEDDIQEALLDEQFEVEFELDDIDPPELWERFAARPKPQAVEHPRPPEVRWGEPHSPPSTSAMDYCEKATHLSYFKRLAVTEGFRNENLMSFDNQGGLLDKGVCWWHSRFQRNALYLTTYRPSAGRPSEREAKQIIAKIRRGRSVVEIPGFANFETFSAQYQELIQKTLYNWQCTDGFLLLAWLNGLAGKHMASAQRLRSIMDELYVEVEELCRITYVKLAIKGITSHAWLVVGMQQNRNDSGDPERVTGYTLLVIDSENPWFGEPIPYEDGMTAVPTRLGSAVPYLQRQGDFRHYAEAIARYRAQHG